MVRLLRVPTLLVACLLLLWPTAARAGGGRRHVPDVRVRAPSASARVTLRVPLTVHVAAPMSPRRVRRWIARANRALAPYRVQVHVARVVRASRRLRSVRRPRDRRSVARFAPRDGTVHVFIVDEIGPVSRRTERRGRTVRGLYWRYRGVRRGLRGREFVLVTTGAPSTTLAHELGHLFGLPHRGGQSNLMCSCRHGPGQSFTRTQGGILRGGAYRFMGRARRGR